MNFLEHVAKARVLAPAGIPVPARSCAGTRRRLPPPSPNSALHGQGAGADRQARQGRGIKPANTAEEAAASPSASSA